MWCTGVSAPVEQFVSHSHPSSETRSRRALVCIPKANSALDLLLGSDVTVVTTLSLPAVGCLEGKLDITFSTNHFLALVLSGQSSKGGLDLDLTHSSSSQAQHEMESGLLLDVVVRKSSSVLQLLSSEDESLLIRRNSFLVLDLSPELSPS